MTDGKKQYMVVTVQVRDELLTAEEMDARADEQLIWLDAIYSLDPGLASASFPRGMPDHEAAHRLGLAENLVCGIWQDLANLSRETYREGALVDGKPRPWLAEALEYMQRDDLLDLSRWDTDRTIGVTPRFEAMVDLALKGGGWRL